MSELWFNTWFEANTMLHQLQRNGIVTCGFQFRRFNSTIVAVKFNLI